MSDPQQSRPEDVDGLYPDADAAAEAVREGDPVAASQPTAESQPTASVGDSVHAAKIAELVELADERTADLQRLQAEYANYKKRVDRDRTLARGAGVESVVLDLLPVLDAVEAAREHGELVGGFKMVADELAKVGGKYGLTIFGEVGEPFDPQLHEALMHVPFAGEHDVTVVSSVMQKGAKLNDRVIRPARVGVADPA